MDSTVSEVPDVVPKRRSLFKETFSVINPNTSTEDNEYQVEQTPEAEKYLELLTSEKDSWKKLYSEIKEKNKALKKKISCTTVQEISLDILDEEDREHINNQPNYVEYMQKVADLTRFIDLVKKQVHQVRLEENSRLKQLKSKISIVEEICCD